MTIKINAFYYSGVSDSKWGSQLASDEEVVWSLRSSHKASKHMSIHIQRLAVLLHTNHLYVVWIITSSCDDGRTAGEMTSNECINNRLPLKTSFVITSWNPWCDHKSGNSLTSQKHKHLWVEGKKTSQRRVCYTNWRVGHLWRSWCCD